MIKITVLDAWLGCLVVIESKLFTCSWWVTDVLSDGGCHCLLCVGKATSCGGEGGTVCGSPLLLAGLY